MIRKTMIALAGAVMAILAFTATAEATGGPPPPNSNQVEFWCPTGGVKVENVNALTFTVPEPPAGFVWTLLVLKAGDENSTPVVNETFPNPVVGQAYERLTDDKNISHAILCHAVTTTVPTTPTTVCEGEDENGRPCVTTTTTATTLPTTTTTATTLPTTTTTGNIGICCLQGTTTVATTVPAATTVVTTVPPTAPPTTLPAETIPPVVEETPPAPAAPAALPVTGGSLGAVGIGGAFIALGVAFLWSRRFGTA